ncbi:MAG: nicotinate-nucleotide adenylyltransferase [Micrococcales bacterium]
MTASPASSLPRSIGVFGGSFDPIHNGHLAAAKSVLDALDLDEIVFVPAGNQWQKQNQTSAAHRLAMVRLAIAHEPAFSVSEVDTERTGPTYTFDTLTDLKALHPRDKLFFILGTDAASGLASWRNASEMLDLAQFVVISRPGSALELPEFAQGRVWTLDIPALDISSTDFRREATANRDVTGHVPASVLRYIEENNLYGISK